MQFFPSWGADAHFYDLRQEAVKDAFALLVLHALYSAAFKTKPFVIMSEGSTGYSPEKQASQYCGQLLSRPLASPTAR
jgi:hypothetical protein